MISVYPVPLFTSDFNDVKKVGKTLNDDKRLVRRRCQFCVLSWFYYVPCDFYLFDKLHLSIKGKRYADIEDIKWSTTAILNIISTDEIRISFNSLLGST